MLVNETVVAKATANAQSAIGIIKISGRDALSIAKKMFVSKILKGKFQARTMYLGEVLTKNFKDKALCVYFKAPYSYTGEDVVEFHLHGGIKLVDGVYREVVSLGARPAHPGEFTKRAFLNGKVDLAEAEGISDMISADSEAEIMQAYRLMRGDLSKKINQSQDFLVEAIANLEVALDFPEELEEETKVEALVLLKKIKKELKAIYESSNQRKYIKDGITISICGLTNVGKSSLMNAILKDERAIVTEIAGTTRDILKEDFMLEGFKVNLLDTAGIRESQDKIEKIGIEKAFEAIKGADLILFVMDTSEPESESEKELFKQLNKEKTIRVANKGDIAKYERQADVLIEAESGKNIEKLMDIVLEKVNAKNLLSSTTIMRERHIYAVKKALESLGSAIKVYERETLDCILVDLKQALWSLSQITGEDVEERVVDKIFSKFCVGK